MKLPQFSPQNQWTAPAVSCLPSWADANRICIDIETNDPDLKRMGPGVRTNGYVIGVGFAIEDGPAAYLPIRHGGGGNLDEAQVWAYLRDQAAATNATIVHANGQYDHDYLLEHGVDLLHCPWFDVQLADPCIYELHKRNSLDIIAERWGVPGKDETLLRQWAECWGIDPKSGMHHLPARAVGAYAEQDCRLPLQLARLQEEKIRKEGLEDVFRLESQLQPVLLKMRRRGVRVDIDKVDIVRAEAKATEAKILSDITRRSGVRVGPEDTNRTAAWAQVLRNVGVEVPKTAKGADSVTTAVLNSINHPIARLIREAKKYNKLYNTFCDSAERFVVNGRIHCTFNQMRTSKDDGTEEENGAKYGRLSCVNPNLQQQPSPDRDPIIGKAIRNIFLPDEGTEWACLDYCFDDQTEVLTDRGFVLFSELTAEDQFAQVDRDTREVTYTPSTDRQAFPFNGEMVHVTGRHVDLMMSPNHNCLLYRKGEPVIVKADQYENHRNYYTQQLNAAEMYGQTAFTVRHEDAPLLHPGRRKLFNREALLSMDKKSRHAFLAELLLRDGSNNYYCTTEKANAEVVHEISVLSGIRANLSRRPQPGSREDLYVVSFSRGDRVSTETLKVSRQAYDGMIYCVTVPTHTIIVRRNGKVSVTAQSQQEPRWTIHYAELVGAPKAAEAAEAYRQDPDTDYHGMVATLINPDWPNLGAKEQKAQRSRFKNISLGKAYGMGGAKLCLSLGLPIKTCVLHDDKWYQPGTPEAEQALKMGGVAIPLAGEEGAALIEKFNEGVPYLSALEKKAERAACIKGYIKTAGGRRCHFPRLKSPRRVKRQNLVTNFDWVHKALNRLIQGSAGDQMKQAMINMDREGVEIQLQVHDEVDLSIRNRDDIPQIVEIMLNAIPCSVPHKVDVEIGPSWGEIE